MLTPTAAAMMCASGVFSTEGQVQRFRLGRFAAAVAVVVTAATLAVAGDPRAPSEDGARGTHLLLAQSEALSSLGVGDYTGAAELADLAPAAAPDALSAQDRFEIERMFRRAGAAR